MKSFLAKIAEENVTFVFLSGQSRLSLANKYGLGELEMMQKLEIMLQKRGVG